MGRALKIFSIWLVAAPIMLGAVLFIARGWPSSWRTADWSSTGTMPDPGLNREAMVRVYSARTGRWKGILAVHSWLVIKRHGAPAYTRYDVVGWGRPVRRNAWPVDGRWYSNMPKVIYEARGKQAARLIPQIEAAIASYPYNQYGSYHIWPGPNSNSFIAYVARAVPSFKLQMDPGAVGKDYLGAGFNIAPMPSNTGWQASLSGLIGGGFARAEGIELHLLGATIGVGFSPVSLKLPALGRIDAAALKDAYAHALGTMKAVAASLYEGGARLRKIHDVMKSDHPEG